MSQRTADSIFYSPRQGATLVLHACSQHYHCKIENVQACSGQQESTGGACPPNLPESLPNGSWVEIHTAYHAGLAVVPLPENLDSCKVGPVVVVGYHARVSSAQAPPPVPLRFGPPAAEWWGSSTGTKDPECKDPAFWHFVLGCDFTVTRPQLKKFDDPEAARPLQSQNRLSRDLTHIVRSKTP